MKRICSFIFALVILCTSVVAASAVDFGCTVDTVSDGVYLENLDTGIVVYEKNAEEIMYPASTTKVMTYIIVAENVPDFDNTMIEITEGVLESLDPESSVMGLTDYIGESFSVHDLLYGLMLPSGNDAALVLADYVGHGVDGFVDLMNRKAAQLGCENTHFVSPHGLFDPDHYSTPKDMATITKYAMQKKDFIEITASTRYTPSGFSEPLKTTNYMIDSTQEDGAYYYPYAKGIKTGYTDEAGRCLISTAEKDGYTYLCVALGADYSFIDEINYAMLDTADLYDWAFGNLSQQVVYSSLETIHTVAVKYVWGDKRLDLVPEDEVRALLPNNYDPDLITTKLEWNSEIEQEGVVSAPVEQGEVFGSLNVYYDGLPIGSTDIVASEAVSRDRLNYLIHRLAAIVRSNFLWFVVILIVIILVIVVVVSRLRRRRAERRRRRFR